MWWGPLLGAGSGHWVEGGSCSIYEGGSRPGWGAKAPGCGSPREGTPFPAGEADCAVWKLALSEPAALLRIRPGRGRHCPWSAQSSHVLRTH